MTKEKVIETFLEMPYEDHERFQGLQAHPLRPDRPVPRQPTEDTLETGQCLLWGTILYPARHRLPLHGL